jgi:protein ImuB
VAFACIFVPDFPIAALLRAEPELRSQALAVLEGKPPLQKVAAVNESARGAGVAMGMTKVQLEACQGIALRMRSPLEEKAAHAALLDGAQSFSPRVEDTRDDTLVLDLCGLEMLWGPPSKMARDLAQRASRLGLKANVAVASNPDTAMIAARGFCGVTLIPEGKETEQLGGLPLQTLFGDRAQPPFLETFARWGIRHLRDLAALPEVALSERLGQEGLRLQQLARGITSRTLVPVALPLIFEEAIELEYPLVLLEPLAFLLHGMLERLCARLEMRALATQELRLELELQKGSSRRALFSDRLRSSLASDSLLASQDAGARSGSALDKNHLAQHDSEKPTKFKRTLSLPVPLLDSKTFLKLLQLDLNAHPPGAPIVGIRLWAEPVRPRAVQNQLFIPPSPPPEKLELTLARIAGIVGEERVGSVQLLDTYRPEGFHMQPFGVHGAGVEKQIPGCARNEKKIAPPLCASVVKSKATTTEDTEEHREQVDEAAITALRIFRPVVHAAVTLREGKPARLACPQRREMNGEILWTAGPWRSSGDWWEQQGWARDEWDIALQQENGIRLYRLVRDRLRGKWLVEGAYD